MFVARREKKKDEDSGRKMESKTEAKADADGEKNRGQKTRRTIGLTGEGISEAPTVH